MQEIELAELIDGPEIDICKIHLASWNGDKQPLDVFVNDRNEWQDWNKYRGQRDDFNRQYIFSLINFYPEQDTWLFGGLFKITKRHPDRYEIQLQNKFQNLVGRLKIKFKRSGRAKAVLPEKQFERMSVAEILRQPYTGEVFPGYENICLQFNKLESIIRLEKKDWKSALSNVKGVYLIADTSNGKKYVGSAYGTTGIWSRWSCYIGTGHGHNDDFSRIINEHGVDYAHQNFVFTLLEYRPMKTDDYVVIERETFWKVALLTRGEHGYNKN